MTTNFDRSSKKQLSLREWEKKAFIILQDGMKISYPRSRTQSNVQMLPGRVFEVGCKVQAIDGD